MVGWLVGRICINPYPSVAMQKEMFFDSWLRTHSFLKLNTNKLALDAGVELWRRSEKGGGKGENNNNQRTRFFFF